MSETIIIDGQDQERAWENAGDALKQLGTFKTFFQCVSEGLLPAYNNIQKFGENPSLDTADGFEAIWDGGIAYVAPTAARIHQVASSLAGDAGTVLSSGPATGGSNLLLIDALATFVSDGVAIGDYILNDSDGTFGQVAQVVSETVLATFRMASPVTGGASGVNMAGDAYRVVASAGMGAAIFWVTGLDGFYDPLSEFVVLNGITNVPTIGSYIRQFRARVFLPGSSEGAVGVIKSTADVDATVTCQIVDGNNQTLMAIYTIPRGKKGYMYNWWGGSSKKQSATSIFRLRAGQLGGITYIQHNQAVNSLGNSQFKYQFAAPLIFTSGTDIIVTANTDANGTGLSAGFYILLKDD